MVKNYVGQAHMYSWILVIGTICSFFDAMGIGMNDMANSFGVVYGSKVLNKWQIVLVAAACEFTGAMVLGKNVVSTISGGITKTSYFAKDPYVLMYGFLCALAASICWTWFATYCKLPVSTTHSIVGAILGFSLVFGGKLAINWYGAIDTFPFVSGFAPIVMSWFTSPIFACILSCINYSFVKLIVLTGTNNGRKAAYLFPFFVFVTFFICSWLIIAKGGNNRGGIAFATDLSKVSWVAAIVGAVASLISCATIPINLKNLKIEQERVEKGDEKVNTPLVQFDRTQMNCFQVAHSHFFQDPVFANKDQHDEEEDLKGFKKPSDRFNPLNLINIKAKAVDMNSFVSYDPGAEYIFRYLQIFTAMTNSFAHGSNDVGNAVAPLAGIYGVWTTGKAQSKVEIPTWIIALGATGIVVGLATYGLKILELLGHNITHITPIRGFSAELASSWIVCICSAYGMPVSTTQVITGAVVGIAVMDKGFDLPYPMLGKIFFGWCITLCVTGSISAFIFAQGVYSPAVGYSRMG